MEGKTRFDGVYVEMHPLGRWCYSGMKGAAAVTGAVSKCLTRAELGRNLIKPSRSF